MAREITIGRDAAECLVDLLEGADPCEVGVWRIDLSDQIRNKFGMVRMPYYEAIRKEAIEHINTKGGQ